MATSLPVTSILQRMDAVTRQVTNLVEVLLPDGLTVNIPVTEAQASLLMEQLVGALEPDALSAYTPERLPMAGPSTQEEPDVIVFGGAPTSEDYPQTPPILSRPIPGTDGIPSFVQPAVQAHTYTTKSGQTTTVRTLPTDEAGNPIRAHAPYAESVEDDDDGVFPI